MPRSKHLEPLASGWNSQRFQKALSKLRDDFPECYVEAWTPTDFADPGLGEPWEVSMEEAREVAYKLDKHFDANHGTNWDRLRMEIEETARHLNLPAE